MDTPMDRDSSIRKLAELIGEIRIAMLTTTTEDGSFRSRPMTTQRAKFDGKLWFFTNRESAKVEEVRRHRRVSLSYAKPEDNSYISISGAAEVISDQKKAQELWDTRYEEWFPQGPSDPSLILIRVTAEQAQYWHAPSSVLPMDAGFVVLAPERRDNPEFHSKIARLSEFGPVITTNAPCSSCGMFHVTSYHRAFPNLCGSGDTPREAAEDLIRRMTNEKDFHGDTWHGESVEQAIAEVRTFLEKSA
jgi:general stress protein 26